MSTSTPERLTLREAAAYTGLHIATLRRRIHRGELPAVRIGNRHCVTAKDLDAAFVPVSIVPKHIPNSAFDELEAAAKRVAASAPPLSADQRARLAFLLGGASRWGKQ